ncbi:MAG: exodeoxyribonuclease V subunit beta [Desulfobacteraceae bacterium]|nr:exodeoxyribonuclease V subunit beta [Desulfobacteraceae bacterium]
MEILSPFDVKLENTILIEASAGTGKTYTITTIYTRLVLEGLRPDSILVVTFTEAAAAELKLRIRKRLLQAFSYLDGMYSDIDSDVESNRQFHEYLSSGTEKEIINKKRCLKRALNLFDETSIFTIHSFCLKMLKENAFESRALFDVELSADSSFIEKEICYDFFAERINNLDPLFLKYLKKKNFVPEKLIRKFSKLLSRPDIELIPEAMEFIDVFDAYRGVVKEIGTYIEYKSSEIKDFIQNDSGINKQSYKKNLVANWLEQISKQLSATGQNTVFEMNEKGDSIYKFTLTRLSEKLKTGFDLPEYEFFSLCQNLFEISKVFENNILSLEIEYFKYLKTKLLINKERLGIVFFNDLINDLAHALHDNPEHGNASSMLISAIQEKYHAVLIDEFQDTDQIQYSIFSKLFANRKNLFCMIGDPKQAIYGFRGGDIFAYLKAVEDSKEVYTLDKNYRSDPGLVESVNAVFEKKLNPFSYEKIGFHPVTTPETSENRLFKNNEEASCFKFLFLKNEYAATDIDKKGFIKKAWANDNIPLVTAEDIAKLLNSNTLFQKRKIEPSDIAVIVRKNNQANKISKALKFYKIPSHIYSNDSVFNSEEAVEMTDLLYAVLEPENRGYIKAALLTDIFEFSGNDIDDLDSVEGAFSDWQGKFNNYHALWADHGFIKMIQEIFYSSEAFSKENTSVSKRALTNYNHLIELLHYAESEQHFSPVLLLKWFTREQGRAIENGSQEELRLETDQSAVSIVTIHKSKGLEWPLVYLPYLWDGKVNSNKDDSCLFHDPDDGYREKFDLGYTNIDRARELSNNEANAEDARLLYVALTRAASMVKIIWGKFNSVTVSALGAILHGESVADEMDMLEDIKFLTKNGALGISVDIYKPDELMGKIIPYFQNDFQNQEKFSGTQTRIRTLTRSVFKSWKISSFSSLIAKASNVDYKFSENREMEANLHANAEITLKDFPAGAGSGEFFHSLFEDLDFGDNKENITNLVKQKLEGFGYKSELWNETINKAVQQILSTELLKENNNFILKSIKNKKRLNELEFFFPLKQINSKKVYNFFKNNMKHPLTSKYAAKLLDLDFNSVTGFMKGFIDLVFEFEDKWYIVDYKSNFLGKSYDDYSADAMNDAMMEHHYFLQYHIYVVALHKYLIFRQKNYDYNTHFGGVFYLFIRGMHPKSRTAPTPITGVFYDRPDYEFVNELANNVF